MTTKKAAPTVRENDEGDANRSADNGTHDQYSTSPPPRRRQARINEDDLAAVARNFGGVFSTYAAIVLFAGPPNAMGERTAFPSQDDLMRITGLPPRTLKRHVRQLRDGGHIRVRRRRSGNLYTIPTRKPADIGLEEAAFQRAKSGTFQGAKHGTFQEAESGTSVVPYLVSEGPNTAPHEQSSEQIDKQSSSTIEQRNDDSLHADETERAVTAVLAVWTAVTGGVGSPGDRRQIQARLLAGWTVDQLAGATREIVGRKSNRPPDHWAYVNAGLDKWMEDRSGGASSPMPSEDPPPAPAPREQRPPLTTQQRAAQQRRAEEDRERRRARDREGILEGRKRLKGLLGHVGAAETPTRDMAEVS